jgi:hypothetical protein
MPPLGVLTEGQGLCRLALGGGAIALLLALDRWAPAGLIHSAGSPIVVDADRITFERADALLVNMARAARKPSRPNAGGMTEDAPWRPVLLLAAPRLMNTDDWVSILRLAHCPFPLLRSRRR